MEPELKAEIKEKETGNQLVEGGIDLTIIDRLLEKYRELLMYVEDFHPILRALLRKMRCDRFEWDTAFGVGDAAVTGTLTGLAYSLKSYVISFFSAYIPLEESPRISVEPLWNDTSIRTHLTCIVHFRVGHAIVAGVRILKKLRKGRVRKWQTTPFRA